MSNNVGLNEPSDIVPNIAPRKTKINPIIIENMNIGNESSIIFTHLEFQFSWSFQQS